MTAPLWATVTGTFVYPNADYLPDGDYGDLRPASGEVVLKPYPPDAHQQTPPLSVGLSPIRVTLNVSGQLATSNGTAEITVPAGGLDVHDILWRVDLSGVKAGDRKGTFQSFDTYFPPGQTIDLATVAPISVPTPGGVAVSQGPPGRGIKSLAVDSNYHLIPTYTDDTTGDAGALPPGPPGAGVPTGGSTNQVVAKTASSTAWKDIFTDLGAAKATDYYTKTQGDARYPIQGTGSAAYLTQSQSDARYAQPGSGTSALLRQSDGDTRYYTKAQIDAAPATQPGLSVVSTSTVPLSGWTSIPFNSTEKNQGFAAVTSGQTDYPVPITGWWFLNGSGYLDAATSSSVAVRFLIDGTILNSAYYFVGGTRSLNITRPIYLNAGQKVTFQCNASSVNLSNANGFQPMLQIVGMG